MGLYQATVSQSLAGEVVQNVLGFQTTGATSSGDALSIAAALAAGWGLSMMPLLSTEISMTGVSVLGVDDVTAGADFSASNGGSISEDPFPPFVAAKINLLTGLRGRSYRGRTGVSGIPLNKRDPSNPNQITGTYAGQLLDGFTDAVGAVVLDGPAGSALCVISRVVDGLARPVPIGTPTTSATVPVLLGSRVSRKHR